MTAQFNPKTREAAVQFGVKRIHQWGDTDHFADDEWILLQMTRQMPADEIVCGRETIGNKWTPGDDYIHPGDVQDDGVTTAVREIWGTTGSQPAAILSSVAYTASQRWGTTRTTQRRDKTSHVKMHHAEIDWSHRKLIMLHMHRKIWGECSGTK
jgi:hypothetical protein